MDNQLYESPAMSYKASRDVLMTALTRRAKRVPPISWAKAKASGEKAAKRPELPDLGKMNPFGGSKYGLPRIAWHGHLPPPPDWRPAASLEDFLAQQRDHCIKVFGDLCAKMHDHAFTSVILTDHPEYGFRQGLAHALDATGTPLKQEDAQQALKSLSTSGTNFELVLVDTDFYEWVRNVAKVDVDQYDYDLAEADGYREVLNLLRDSQTFGSWPWMCACFQAVPEALRKGIHVVLFEQGRGDQLDLATGKFPTRQFTLTNTFKDRGPNFGN